MLMDGGKNISVVGCHYGIHESGGHLSRNINTMRTGDVDLRFYITTVQDG